MKTESAEEAKRIKAELAEEARRVKFEAAEEARHAKAEAVEEAKRIKLERHEEVRHTRDFSTLLFHDGQKQHVETTAFETKHGASQDVPFAIRISVANCLPENVPTVCWSGNIRSVSSENLRSVCRELFVHRIHVIFVTTCLFLKYAKESLRCFFRAMCMFLSPDSVGRLSIRVSE